MEQNENILREQVQNAPPEIKQLLANNSWRKVVADVAQKNNFSAEQAPALENEVLFVLLAMELRTDIAKNIQASTGVSNEAALRIAGEVNDGIFNEVTDWLPTEIETVSTPSNLVSNPTQLKSATDVLPPYNLPTSTSLEEKINPLIGSAGDKGEWEKRKQAIGENTIVTSDKYGNSDPYREPIK